MEAYQAALDKVRAELVGKHYPLIINGERVDTAEKLYSINPCDTSEMVGSTAKATIDDAQTCPGRRVEGLRASGKPGAWTPAPAFC